MYDERTSGGVGVAAGGTLWCPRRPAAIGGSDARGTGREPPGRGAGPGSAALESDEGSLDRKGSIGGPIGGGGTDAGFTGGAWAT